MCISFFSVFDLIKDLIIVFSDKDLCFLKLSLWCIDWIDVLMNWLYKRVRVNLHKFVVKMSIFIKFTMLKDGIQSSLQRNLKYCNLTYDILINLVNIELNHFVYNATHLIYFYIVGILGISSFDKKMKNWQFNWHLTTSSNKIKKVHLASTKHF